MRKRNREVILWLTEAEYDRLKRNAKKTGLSVQAYLRKLLAQIQPREAPPIEYFEVLKNLRQINHNMNQIAVVANAKGFVDTAAYWENMKALQQAVGLMMEGMYR